MNKSILLAIALLLVLRPSLNSQNVSVTDSSQNIVEAKYTKGDLEKILYNNVRYPPEASAKGIQGDVIFIININKNGTLDNIAVEKSPNMSLTTSSIIAINALDTQWSPCMINGKPSEKKYKIIFRYRLTLGSEPPDNKGNAESAVKKQKYDKALSSYDKAIKENAYDAELFLGRSGVKENLGDLEGSKQDLLTANKLKSEVLSVINQVAQGVAASSGPGGSGIPRGGGRPIR